MDTNDNKEELIEELSDVEANEPVVDNVASEITPDKKIEDEIKTDVIQEPINVVEDNPKVLEENAETVVLEDEKSEQDEAINPSLEQKEEKDYETVEQSLEEKPKKSKISLIVLLSILLVIDVAALVIYIIGIDKVLGFIK